jgi:hypothetical protein
MISDQTVEKIVHKLLVTRPENITYDCLTDEIIKVARKKSDRDTYDDAIKRARNVLSRSHYVLDDSDRNFLVVPPITRGGWLKMKYFGQSYYTQLPLDYITSHLDEFSSNKLSSNSDRDNTRSERIKKALDDGAEPLSFTPIRLSFTLEDKLFHITDGNNRCKVFKDRQYPLINSELSIYWSHKDLREELGEKAREAYEIAYQINYPYI